MIILAMTTIMSVAEGRLFRQVPTGDFTTLPQSTVYDIRQSDDGYTWLATDNGLGRFDGEHTVTIPLPDEVHGNKIVKTLTQIPGGGLLIGTRSHLYKLTVNNESYKIEPLLDGKPFSATSAVTLENNDAIIGGDDGVVVYWAKNGKTTHIKLSDNVLSLSNNVIDLAQSPNAVYVLTKGGIYRLDKTLHNVTSVDTELEISGLSPTSIACSPDNIYIGTSGDGVVSLNTMTGKLEKTGYVDSGNVVTSLDISNDGKYLYVGTDGGGVTKIEMATGKMTTFRHRVSDHVTPASNQVYSLLSDKNGQLWIGYYQHGADYTPEANGPFELYDNPAVFNSRGIPVRALTIGEEYNAIGTREGVVVHYVESDDSWDVGAPALRSEMVISLLSKDGKIYVGTYGGGMQILDPRNRTIHDFNLAKDDAVFRNGHIFSIATDHKGGLWVGSNDGLYYFDENGNEKHFTSYLTALPEGNVYGIFFDSQGKGWICTDSGVCIYDPERKMLRTDLFPVSFPKDTRFRTVYEDSNRRLYFVPESGYVYSCGLDFSDAQTLDFPMLQDTDAKSVVEDSLGNMWIATNRGIFILDSAGSVMRFGLAAGLPSVSFLQAQPLSDGKGSIWFGNSEGLLKLNENMVEKSLERQVVPVPTKVTVNGIPLEFVPRPNAYGVYEIPIKNTANNIKIGFSTFTYSIEEPDAYEYRIDDGEWTKFKSDLSVSLYDLMPGRHKLHVRSASDSAYMQDKETMVMLKVPYPAVWKIGFCVIVALLVFSIYLAYRIFINKHKDRSKEETTEDVDSEIQTNTPVAVQKKYVANNMSRTEARQISAKIDDVMAKDKPYLNPELKVAMLAEMIGISSHKLSQFFSQHKDISFYDYVNKYRVDEFKRMVREEDVRNLTLSAMAERAGFSSRASFFRYFKNIEGISPGEYLKTRQKA